MRGSGSWNLNEAYWKEQHSQQPFSGGRPYDDFAAAYRIGYEGYLAFAGAGMTFKFVEKVIRREYESTGHRLVWDKASFASKAAWERAAFIGPTPMPSSPYAQH